MTGEPVSFETFQAVLAERDRLRERVAAMLPLLAKAVLPVENLMPLVRDTLQDDYDWVPGWLRDARALLKEGER